MRGTPPPAAPANPVACSARISSRRAAETRSSASMHSTQSWRAAPMANCFCAACPGQSRSTPRAPSAAARSRVASVECESTTTTSSHQASEARQASMRSASLSVITQALTAVSAPATGGEGGVGENRLSLGAGVNPADVAAMAGDSVAELGVVAGVESVGDARRVALVEDVVADAAVGERQQARTACRQRGIGGVGGVLVPVAGEAAAGGVELVGTVERQTGAQPRYTGGGLAPREAGNDRGAAGGDPGSDPRVVDPDRLVPRPPPVAPAGARAVGE